MKHRRHSGKNLKVIITGDAKKIAALVLALQERRVLKQDKRSSSMAKEIDSIINQDIQKVGDALQYGPVSHKAIKEAMKKIRHAD